VATLQDVMLPTDLPLVPSLDLEARYLLAAGHAAGGDWFDAVVRPDGKVALVVGDVVGNGVRAAAVMGQLRAVLQSQLLTRSSVAEALAVLDLYAGREIESRATTVCIVELDTRTGQLEYCTAGHPPPLVVTGTGDARYLDPTGAGPLGTGTGFPTLTSGLADGDLVVLYSDGLVDRPGRSLAEGTVQLREVVRQSAREAHLEPYPSRPAALVCQNSVKLLTHGTGYDDDITVLVGQRRTPAPSFSVSLDAVPATVPAARDAVSDWLLPLGIGSVDDVAVRHAVGELVANAVAHANAGEDPAGAHRVDVEADIDGEGVLACRVHDDGRWLEPAVGSGGLGLGMVRSMVDDLGIEVGPDGTTATFRHRLTREASMLEPVPGATRASATVGRGEALSVAVDGPVLRVAGAMDAQGAERLRVALHHATRGGTAEVVVDLVDITYLGSSGVRVLAEALRDRGVSLVAPPGSVAQHVLDVVQVQHRRAV